MADRHETDDERADRNWEDLLQELRVTQTGVQLIAGFLLTLPFQQRFSQLDGLQTGVYLGLVVLAASTVGLTLTPIAVHRRLFGEHVKQRLVRVADRITRMITVLVSALITGICFLIVDVVTSRVLAIALTTAVAALLVSLLAVFPRLVERRR